MRISAIIPVYNAERYLFRSVESLLSTNYPDIEIIIVDDGSTDNTKKIALGLQRKYRQVFFFEHPNNDNRGIFASRNLALFHSTGELVCFLDADDFVFPHRFDTAVPILVSDSTVDAVYEPTVIRINDPHVQNKERNWWQDGQIFGLNTAVGPDQLFSILLTGVSWHTNGILLRKKIFKKTGAFELPAAEEYDLWLRMACLCKVVPGDMSRPVAAYCRHSANTFLTIIERRPLLIRAMVNAYNHVKHHYIPLSVKRQFIKGLLAYINRTIIVARESDRNDIAWKSLFILISNHSIKLLLHPPLFRQIVWLFFELFRKK